MLAGVYIDAMLAGLYVDVMLAGVFIVAVMFAGVHSSVLLEASPRAMHQEPG
jgi:hypothetical protein